MAVQILEAHLPCDDAARPALEDVVNVLGLLTDPNGAGAHALVILAG